jgi:hypothetical protein
MQQRADRQRKAKREQLLQRKREQRKRQHTKGTNPRKRQGGRPDQDSQTGESDSKSRRTR